MESEVRGMQVQDLSGGTAVLGSLNSKIRCLLA